ncbi:unnamed protein product [Oppiella nova]|uniref:Fe2OG dioxygenase domain-containing protein n=1 Tax=Oppiella nova TaxID=334625 RepID=A0A7R9M8A1_9ACAR|nr:unnamed protein product [Oppiella nova]CAG2172650.1 unnamed protein product [Oppiella nova]
MAGKLMNLSNEYEEEEPSQPLNPNNMLNNDWCRGVIRPPESVRSQLKCFHLNTTFIPFLRLTRIKVEEMYKRPHIVVIHEFLSEFEIQILKAWATPGLERTQVVNDTTGAYIPSKDRLAFGNWIKDEQHSAMATISRRISAITGLDLSTAEDANIIRYGVGGYYGHHYDTDVYVVDNPVIKPKRIATWINYLSDVEAGGATVFPYINVAVWPEKGAGLFWYNMLTSGLIDVNTIHGGCPVLVGTKWIVTKWIRPTGQEFRKLCENNLLSYNVLGINS